MQKRTLWRSVRQRSMLRHCAWPTRGNAATAPGKDRGMLHRCHCAKNLKAHTHTHTHSYTHTNLHTHAHTLTHHTRTDNAGRIKPQTYKRGVHCAEAGLGVDDVGTGIGHNEAKRQGLTLGWVSTHTNTHRLTLDTAQQRTTLRIGRVSGASAVRVSCRKPHTEAGDATLVSSK